jgi:hypothetical protein
LTIEMNVISNSDSLSATSNLDINDNYDLVNDDSSTTDFGENNVSNSKAVLLSSKSRGRRWGKSCGCGRPQTKMLEEINKPKLIIDWIKLIVQEFKIWLGLIIAMGIYKFPSLELYWSNNWLIAILQFITIMTCHQY